MKKTTVTIGIPAYNEEQNIKAFLLSLCRQKTSTFTLKKILVYSDQSSDDTEQIVKDVAKRNPVVQLITGKTRKGKYFRVNELFAMNTSDVLVILDADIALKGDGFLERLVTALMEDKNAVMTSAHAELIRPDGFTPRVLYTMFVLEDMMRLSVPGYDIAPNFHGAATAYKRSFVKTLMIPKRTTDPHLFIYLSAKMQNGFRYCPDSVVLQNPPSTMHDVRQLMRRTIGKRDGVLEKIFGHEMIEMVHYIPGKAKLEGILKCFLREPFYTLPAIITSYYLGRMVHIKNVDTSPVWEINTSTKKPIQYAK